MTAWMMGSSQSKGEAADIAMDLPKTVAIRC